MIAATQRKNLSAASIRNAANLTDSQIDAIPAQPYTVARFNYEDDGPVSINGPPHSTVKPRILFSQLIFYA